MPILLNWVMTSRSGLAVMAFAMAGLLPSARAGAIDSIYAFGDSLSDVGNAFIATSGVEPGAPYVNGQFSNGPVWIQDLAAALGFAPLTPSLTGGTDYAFGAGETGPTSYNTSIPASDLTGSTGQIAQFMAAHPSVDPNGLYTIWIGANDLSDILAGASPSAYGTDIATSVANVDSAIASLAGAGAKNFLIVTVPDLGVTPGATALGPTVAGALSALSFGFDSTLVNGSGPIPSLAAIAGADGLNLHVLDTFSLVDAIVASPGSFGFTNATGACLTGEVDYAGGTPCSPSVAVQDQYLFWDQIHPTAAGHAVVADAALAVLAPEPGSVLLTASGLLGLGLFLRRRRA
jgi:phospholipase/lecithinase/hemolysin